jgi:hypothetical protein
MTETTSRFSTAEPDPGGADGHADANPDGVTESVKSAMHSLGEARSYFNHYIQAKLDGAKATARLMVLYAFLSVFGIIVALSATVTATVLLVMGVAGGLARLLGGAERAWLANLLVGAVFIAGVGIGMSVAYPLILGRLRRRTVRKYDAIQRRQQMDFGHCAAEKATSRTEHAHAG